jgi:uncharacterized protein YecT (DUF1311 family)
MTRFRFRIFAALAALVPAALLVAAAPAAADEARDARFVAGCLEVNLRNGAAAAEQRCVGLLSRSCMNGPNGAAAAGQAKCLLRETAAWRRVLDGAWEELEPRVAAYDAEGPAGGAHEALLAAQEAWREFAAAECGYAYALWGDGSFRDVAGADCRLNVTARRAIQIRAQLGLGD